MAAEKGDKRSINLTAEQRYWLDQLVARRRLEIAKALQPGQEMPFVNRSFVIREWIDGEIAKEAA